MTVEEMSPAGQGKLIQALEPQLARQLKKPATLATRQVRRAGEWGMVWADLRSANGDAPLDYSDTHLAQAAEAGAVAHRCLALLRWMDPSWAVIELLVGPASMVWKTWPRQYGLPATLFQALD